MLLNNGSYIQLVIVFTKFVNVVTTSVHFSRSVVSP